LVAQRGEKNGRSTSPLSKGDPTAVVARPVREYRVVVCISDVVCSAFGSDRSESIPCARTKYTTITNAQAREMLDKIQADIKEHYYDPTMHGVDLNKRFDEARQKIAAAKSKDEALLTIAGAVAALKDSHTSFRPPTRPYGVDYGFSMQAIGDSDCYVTAVRPESDAAAKGLKPGDRMLSINGMTVVRANINAIEYGYRVFPQSGFHLAVRSPDATERTLVTMAKVLPGQIMITHSNVLEWARANREVSEHDRSRYHEVSKRILFWKLPDFLIDPHDVTRITSRAHSYETVVLDLRGNPGGNLESMERLIGEFFDRDVKVGDTKGREPLKPTIAKTAGKKAFGGMLIVLVDSESKSAAEVFARTIQLEKRGIVLGDRSGGAVMVSKYFVHAVQLDRINVTQYGAMITVADLVMNDGKSLEGIGVVPDERILPTPEDTAAGRDPVLARAATLAGVTITPDEAGKIFPFEWPKERMPEID
jgi:carboxyl-terminal processing protease